MKDKSEFQFLWEEEQEKKCVQTKSREKQNWILNIKIAAHFPFIEFFIIFYLIRNSNKMRFVTKARTRMHTYVCIYNIQSEIDVLFWLF